MDANLSVLHQQVMDARYPEDVYSSEDIALPESMVLTFLERVHTELLAQCNADRYSNPIDSDAALEVRERLEELYAEAKVRIANGVYGLPEFGGVIPASASRHFEIGSRTYYLGARRESDGSQQSYDAYLQQAGIMLGRVAVSIASTPEHNYLLERQIRNTYLLHRLEVPQWKHLPFLLDTFTSGRKVGAVFRAMSGVCLSHVRQHQLYREGVDQRHMVWILDRLLSCLGYVHSQGIVHTAIDPTTVLVTSESHNCTVIGWQYAAERPAKTKEKSLAVSSVYSAPEVRSGGPLGPWTDIYSLGKLMIWLLGGNPETNSIPDEVEWPLREFLLKLVKESPSQRPDDAWRLYREQNAIKDSLWERRFIAFPLR